MISMSLVINSCLLGIIHLSKGMVSLHDNKHVPSHAYKQKKQHITYYILEANSNFKNVWNVGQDQKQNN
jgi:hypothetical protein